MQIKIPNCVALNLLDLLGKLQYFEFNDNLEGIYLWGHKRQIWHFNVHFEQQKVLH